MGEAASEAGGGMEDPEKVDGRRKSMGLSPLADNKQVFKERRLCR
jgi:hypothetical protein